MAARGLGNSGACQFSSGEAVGTLAAIKQLCHVDISDTHLFKFCGNGCRCVGVGID